MKRSHRTRYFILIMISLFIVISKGTAQIVVDTLYWNGTAYYAYGYVTSIQTPNLTNVNVIKFETDAWTSSVKKKIKTYYQNNFPQATFLSEATSTYNCHNYAWNMTEGGDDYWMNDPSAYMTDWSYVETSSAYAEKIFYYMVPYGYHSAVPSSVSGMYDSKWGSAPLMRHAPTYGPYSNMNYRKYYAKPPKISGHNIVTNTVSSTFSLAFAPLNLSINWIFNTSLFTAVGSTTGSSVTIKAKSSTTVGTGTLTAQFKDSGGNIVATSTYAIYANRLPTQSTPSLRVVRSSDGVEVYPSSTGLCPNTFYYAYLSGTSSSYSYNWDMNHATVYSSSSSQAYFKTDDQGWTFLDIYAVDTPTGVSQNIYGVTLYGGSSCE